MEKNYKKLKFIISHAKSYGFIFQSSEIYDGLKAVYDYGQYGILLKNNIKEYWWKSMTQLHENIVGIESSILMHNKIWKASGHIDEFNDILLYNENTKKNYRIDLLIEDFLEKINNNILFYNKKINYNINYIKKKFKKKIFYYIDECFNKNYILDIKSLINKLNIYEPNSGYKIYKINLMFIVYLKNLDNNKKLYLRPETAQGSFINFLNVKKTSKIKIPFGIAQIGKVFRNEIIARQFIFRMREFEQMEMQFFVCPGEEEKWYSYWKEYRLKWHLSLGIKKDNYRFYNHDKLAHYSKDACDIQFKFPFGFKELEGIHSRTDFDLKNHEKFSKKKLRYFDFKKKISYIPYIIETSIGLDRMFLAIFSSCLKEEKIKNDINNKRIVFKIPYILSPIKVAILPLVKKKELTFIGKKIFKKFKLDYSLVYDEKDSIGKRYRIQDAIGTPICLTIDYDSLKDNCVTIRYRDSMNQKRIPILKIKKNIEKSINIKLYLKWY
uniref:glycine--tRNA ligase n=1 Tax=Candidatus Karelsulcia muelleri TaxID=336810 RepID=UPI0032B12DCA